MNKRFTIIILATKIINRISWLVEDLLWMLLTPFYRIRAKKINCSLTFGITTFMDRYDNCLKPLLSKLVNMAPNCQIVVAANGHVKKQQQQAYLKHITELCNRFDNVQLISYVDPQGLSHLWNQIISNANYEKILLINDDVKIKSSFMSFIIRSGILDQHFATINMSWSHFLISKQIIKRAGWFDEGLKEIGGEDDDYLARLAMESILVPDYLTNTITGKLKRNKKMLFVNSYGKNMRTERNGYSTYNSEYLENKWYMSQNYFDGAIEVPNRIVRYWKLKT